MLLLLLFFFAKVKLTIVANIINTLRIHTITYLNNCSLDTRNTTRNLICNSWSSFLYSSPSMHCLKIILIYVTYSLNNSFKFTISILSDHRNLNFFVFKIRNRIATLFRLLFLNPEMMFATRNSYFLTTVFGGWTRSTVCFTTRRQRTTVYHKTPPFLVPRWSLNTLCWSSVTSH